MLPPALKSDYKEYKMDTNSIASWLASTAKLCGHSPSSSLSQQASAPSGRLKGKARKEAKEKAKSAASAGGAGSVAGAAAAASSSSAASSTTPSPPPPPPSPPGSLQKRIIAIKDFVPLAELIAASRKPVITVPVALMNTLARVIGVRAQFGVRMAKAGVAGTSESDASHGYFVGVLEKVQSIFKTRVAATATATTAGAGTGTAARTAPETPSVARTGFGALRMFESSQTFDDAAEAPPVQRPEKPDDDDGDNVVYEAEPLSSWEDAVAALGLMMQDLSQIRGQIMDMWMLYAKDRRDLAAVSVAIQAATDFARLIMEDAEPIFQRHGGVVAVVDKFTTSYVMRKAQALAMAQRRNGREAVVTADGKVQVDMPFNYYDLSNEFYLGSGQFLAELAGLAIPDCIPAFRRNVVGYYDPMLEEKALRPDQKFCRDKAILEMVWADAAVIASRVPEYPVEDEFVRGIRELKRTGTLPFMLIFAGQVLLDIHHLSRYHIGSPARNVLWELDNLKTFTNSFFEVHGDATTARWTAAKSRALRQLQKSVSSFLDDPVLKAKAKREDPKAGRHKEKHYAMMQNPLLAGLVLFHFRAGALENGLDVVNAWGTLAVPAHLYNAIRQENISDRTWPDMEILFKALGESRFFLGGKPTLRDTFFDRYAIQMGVSASTFSPTGRAAETRARNNKSKVAQLFAKNGSRKIENVAPVCAMFMDRFWRRTGQLSWTPEHVEEVLSYSQFDNDADGEEFRSQRIVDIEKLRERRRGKPRGAAGVEVSPAQLVSSLLSALQSEALEFVFPYLCMHLTSVSLLRRISDECQKHLSLPLPAALDQGEGFITYPTAAILRLAQGVNGEVDHSGLKIAAEILDPEYQIRGCVAYVVLKGGVAGWKGFGEVTAGENMVRSSVVHGKPSQ